MLMVQRNLFMEDGETMNARRLTVLFTLCVAACCSLACHQTIPHIPFEGRPHDLYPGAPINEEARFYRIGVGDLITVLILRHPEFSGEAKVDPYGTIMLPLTFDRVQVAGLTLDQASEEISKVVSPYVMLPPKTVVRLRESNSRFFYVMGAVGMPGKYPLGDERLYVREALVRAAWPLREASLHRAKLVSSGPEHNVIREINLKELLYRGDLRQNYEMKPGDIVWVPRSWAREISYWARVWLEPFALLLSYDQMATELYTMPTWQEKKDLYDGRYGPWSYNR